MHTRVFKSGNSLAVRIPKELSIVMASQDVEIRQVGNTLVISPLEQRTLGGLAKKFSAFSPDFMTEGRELHEQAERDWEPLSERAP